MLRAQIERIPYIVGITTDPYRYVKFLSLVIHASENYQVKIRKSLS